MTWKKIDFPMSSRDIVFLVPNVHVSLDGESPAQGYRLGWVPGDVNLTCYCDGSGSATLSWWSEKGVWKISSPKKMPDPWCHLIVNMDSLISLRDYHQDAAARLEAALSTLRQGLQ